MKKLVTSIVVALAVVAVATAAEIRNVTAKQRYPWNGKVDITYEVVGDVTAGFPSWNQPFLSVMATNRTDGSYHVAAMNTLSGNTGTTAGSHHVVWDMSAQGLDFNSDDVVFTVAYVTYGKYCVIDLSGGANALAYSVSYLVDVPSGGWTDEYKTTKLVLRLIEPGSIPTRDATITKHFYCGVFEVTQKQYELVTGSNPSRYTGYMRPVDYVSWDMIRGDSPIYDWPNFTNVDPNSFVGRIQARTGLNFDLPTEAQWEYACRAGTTSAYNNGGDTKNDLMLLGRWADGDWVGNRYDGKGGYSEHTTVGSYQPNAWGLYDMHGNVWEWCLNWYGGEFSGTDPVGPSSGTYRVNRGGSWQNYWEYCCSSSYRGGSIESFDEWEAEGIDGYDRHVIGFRIVRTLSN